MIIALALVTRDCGSQFRELVISVLAFVLDGVAFRIHLVGRSLALEVIKARTRVGFDCLCVALRDGARFGRI